MARILKQISSSLQERMFPAVDQQKSRPAPLPDEVPTSVPIVSIKQKSAPHLLHTPPPPHKINHNYRRLARSSDDLLSSCSASQPPPSVKNGHQLLHMLGERGRGMLRRVRRRHSPTVGRLPSSSALCLSPPSFSSVNPVTRSDSFKFQPAGGLVAVSSQDHDQLLDRSVVPPRRLRRKCVRGPFLPQLAEDYCAPVDLINRAKFRLINSRGVTQVVQVEENYSEALDCKRYMVPGDDGSSKIYCSSHENTSLPAEGSTCDPHASNGPDFYCNPYRETHRQADGCSAGLCCRGSCSYCTRFTQSSSTSSSSSCSSSSGVGSCRLPHTPSPTETCTSSHAHHQPLLYENVQYRRPSIEPGLVAWQREGRDGTTVGTSARVRQFSRSCDNLDCVELWAESDSGCFHDCNDMGRHLYYETAFDTGDCVANTTRPAAHDPDLLVRLAHLPVGSRDLVRTDGDLPASQVSVSVAETADSIVSCQCRLTSHVQTVSAVTSGVATAHVLPVTADHKPESCGTPAPQESARHRSATTVFVTPADNTKTSPATTTLEPVGLTTAVSCSLFSSSSCGVSRSDSSGRSSLSSLSSGGDGGAASGGAGVVARRVAASSWCVPALSPISDRSHEPDSPADLLQRVSAAACGMQAEAMLAAPGCRRGSDSGVSALDTSSPDVSHLPFDMPKLRRRKMTTPPRSSPSWSPGEERCFELPPAPRPNSISVSNLQSRARDRRVRLSLNISNCYSSRPDGASEQSQLCADNVSSACSQRQSLDLPLLGARSACQQVDVSLPLHKQSWYHGAITRVEAENILREHTEGSYLVRISESSRRDYSMSLKSPCGFMHMKIRRDPASGLFILGQFSKPFESIALMIRHYSWTKLPIRGAEHMSLQHPVADEQFL